jgi:hypothetical protein
MLLWIIPIALLATFLVVSLLLLVFPCYKCRLPPNLARLVQKERVIHCSHRGGSA